MLIIEDLFTFFRSYKVNNGFELSQHRKIMKCIEKSNLFEVSPLADGAFELIINKDYDKASELFYKTSATNSKFSYTSAWYYYLLSKDACYFYHKKNNIKTPYKEFCPEQYLDIEGYLDYSAMKIEDCLVGNASRCQSAYAIANFENENQEYIHVKFNITNNKKEVTQYTLINGFDSKDVIQKDFLSDKNGDITFKHKRGRTEYILRMNNIDYSFIVMEMDKKRKRTKKKDSKAFLYKEISYLYKKNQIDKAIQKIENSIFLEKDLRLQGIYALLKEDDNKAKSIFYKLSSQGDKEATYVYYRLTNDGCPMFHLDYKVNEPFEDFCPEQNIQNTPERYNIRKTLITCLSGETFCNFDYEYVLFKPNQTKTKIKIFDNSPKPVVHSISTDKRSVKFKEKTDKQGDSIFEHTYDESHYNLTIPIEYYSATVEYHQLILINLRDEKYEKYKNKIKTNKWEIQSVD